MRNVRKLFQTKSSENDFACIHALRVFSISWIVFGHTLEWNSLNMYRKENKQGTLLILFNI